MVATALTTLVPTINSTVSTLGTAIDATNGNSFIYSQNTALIVHNTDTDALTITITSNADAKGFTKTITKSIAASEYCVVNFLDENFQTGGSVTVTYAGTTPAGMVFPVRLELGR